MSSIRPDHVLVHADVADKFLSLCKEKLVEMFGTDIQKSPDFGRIINPAAWERLHNIIQMSSHHIYVGGKSDKHDKYIEPTILDYGTDTEAFDRCAAMQDEIFGPIVSIEATHREERCSN